MKYFRKLIIENFQSHKYTEIDFVPGLNVFVGPSDSGKSSILRALKWVLFNQPRGKHFIREGASQCRVCLIFDDGTELVRIRGKSENRYLLRTVDGKEEIYESLGQGPHPMIVQAHQMLPSWGQKDEPLQFGSQLEGPFLLSETGGTKAKLIGRISGAHWIDLALKETTRERSQVLSEMRQIEKQKESIEERLKPFHDVPQLEEAVKKATKAYQWTQVMKQKLERLTRLLEQLQTIRREQEKQRALLQSFQNLNELEQGQLRNERQFDILRRLNQLFQNWKRVQSESRENQRILQQTSNLMEAESSYLHIDERIGRARVLEKLAMQWTQCRKAKSATRDKLHKLKDIPKLVEGYEKLDRGIDRFRQLRKCQSAWFQIEEKKKQCNQYLDLVDPVMAWSTKRFPELEERMIHYQRLTEVFRKYKQIQKNLSVGKEYLRQQMQKIEESTQAYMELLKISGRCPTCGSPVSTSLLDHLEQELYGGGKYAAVGRADERDETKVGES